jgi:sugar lactone lactonase YvrE
LIAHKRLSAISALWLLVASTFVFVLASHSQQVSAFQATGQFAMTVIGQPDYVSSNGSATQSTFGGPYKDTFDSSGNLWVADEGNHRVLEFKPPFTDDMEASLVLGQKNFTADGIRTTQWGTSEVASVTFDAQGDLWITDWVNNRVLEFKPPFSDGMNASLELGQAAGPNEFTTSQAIAHLPGQVVNPHFSNELAAPVDVAFDSSGNLWVSDRLNNRVLEFKPPFASGMNASSVIGQANLTTYSYSATPTPSSLFGPQGLAFDSQGNLWVADQSDNRILEYAASSLGTNDPQAILEIGQPAGTSQLSNRTATDTPEGLDGPTVIAFDSSGNLWAVDHLNNRVLEFKAPFTDGMSASLEIGQAPGPDAFTSNSATTSQDGFDNPLGLAFDSQGNLWVVDQNNNRVLEFSEAAQETAGTTVSIMNATEGSDASVAKQEGSCEVAGEQTICHLTFDQTTLTGVKADVTGTASGATADLYSSYFGSREPGGAGTSPPFQTASASYYGLSVEGIANGTAAVCISPQQSVGAMAYYSEGTWASSTVSSRTGSSICGPIPLSAMSYGQVVVALESSAGSGVNSGLGSQLTAVFQIAGASAVLGGAAVVAVVLVSRRRRRRPDVIEEDEDDGGLDEWI